MQISLDLSGNAAPSRVGMLISEQALLVAVQKSRAGALARLWKGAESARCCRVVTECGQKLSLRPVCRFSCGSADLFWRK